MHNLQEMELFFASELEAIVDSFGLENQDGVKEALRFCQETFGCISKFHQEQIAHAFQVNQTTISVFMRLNKALKESITEYEIICCTGGRCSKEGSLAIIQAIQNELGMTINATSIDGKIRLLSQNCFKQCNLAPNILINGKFHHQMDAKRATILIKEIKDKVSAKEAK